MIGQKRSARMMGLDPSKRSRREAAAKASTAWREDQQAVDLIFEPLERGKTTHAVIWLHGLDDTPDSWAERLASERRRHPRWKWVHLRAPDRAITCYNKMTHAAWGEREGSRRKGGMSHAK